MVFMTLALVLGAIFFSKIEFPMGLEAYFKMDYYNQFGPVVICIELLIAGVYLFIGHHKANFTLALYGFTALLDPLLNLTGIITSMVPGYATISFLCCAILALWVVFSDPFGLGRISLTGVLSSFILGVAVELFFNYL